MLNAQSVSKAKINKIVEAKHYNPHEILGMHKEKIEKENVMVIRYFNPHVKNVKIKRMDNIKEYEMDKVHKDGFYEKIINEKNFFPYVYIIEYSDGKTQIVKDPYRFENTISDYDQHLFNEGNHHYIYNKLGAHIMEVNSACGVRFALWAPNAKRVSVVGDFNSWDGRIHQMRVLGSSGIWEIFIPDIKEGTKYKFEVLTGQNHLLIKTDPYAFYNEVRPKTASCIYDINKYKWNDSLWMDERSLKNINESPLNIYEVHLGSWMRIVNENFRFLTYHELAEKLVSYVVEMGYTHIEVLPVAEHPLDDSWGYQVTGYFAPTSRFGTPDDFRYFIDICHQNNIGVIVDWVPAHFPKDGHSLVKFDGTSLYEHEDPRKGEHADWGTLIFNYGRNEVKNFLISNAVFWFENYHIDGIRVDAVASMLYLDYSKNDGEWIPNEYGGRENLDAINFLQQMNHILYSYFPGIVTIAEESTAWPGVSRPTYLGGLGFGMKWNMGWMHDILEYFSKDPIHRNYHHNNLTFTMLYAFHENFVLPLSHDEVVHGKHSMLDKMPGDYWQKFANLRLLYSYMFGQPGKKLNFMGSEIGQWNEWNFSDSIQWDLLKNEPHIKLKTFVKDLNDFYRREASLWQNDFDYSGFDWIDFSDSTSSIVCFMRKAKDHNDYLIMIYNFTPVTRINYRIGVPHSCSYKEVFNSDSELYGGSNLGNMGEVKSENVPWHKFQYSLKLTIPPLGALFFKPDN